MSIAETCWYLSLLCADYEVHRKYRLRQKPGTHMVSRLWKILVVFESISVPSHSLGMSHDLWQQYDVLTNEMTVGQIGLSILTSALCTCT